MTFKTAKVLFTTAIAIAGLIASLLIGRYLHRAICEKETLIEVQNTQLTRLMMEHRRLSNLLAQPVSSANTSAYNDFDAERAKLESEAEALRRRTNELGKHPAEQQRAPSLPFTPTEGSSASDPVRQMVVSGSQSEEYKQQLYRIGASSPHFGPFNIDARKDAQNLAHALRSYATEHDGEVPSSFEAAADHLFKEYRAPNADEYEIVYEGSLNEVTNIPQQAIALVRERQPWPTPDGKLGRIYVMASGFVKIVESDDNFQTWESEHVLPMADTRVLGR